MKCPHEFLDEIPGGVDGENHRKNFWRKSPEQFLEEPLEDFCTGSSEELLDVISEGMAIGNSLKEFMEKTSEGVLGRNSWKNSEENHWMNF